MCIYIYIFRPLNNIIKEVKHLTSDVAVTHIIVTKRQRVAAQCLACPVPLSAGGVRFMYKYIWNLCMYTYSTLMVNCVVSHL